MFPYPLFLPCYVLDVLLEVHGMQVFVRLFIPLWLMIHNDIVVYLDS